MREGRSGHDIEAATVEEKDWGGLMARAQTGDQAAYRALLGALVPYLRRLARRQLDATEAEDAVQDILLSLHAIRRTYDPARPFKPWLVTIARRRLIDRLRRRPRGEVPLEPGVTLADDRANPDEKVLDLPALRHAVEALPARQKEAVQLLRLKEMSTREAAAASGRSEGSLKVSLHRALLSLRQALTRTSGKDDD